MVREIYEVFGQHCKIAVGKLNHKSDVAYSRLVSARSITKPKTSKDLIVLRARPLKLTADSFILKLVII